MKSTKQSQLVIKMFSFHYILKRDTFGTNLKLQIWWSIYLFRWCFSARKILTKQSRKKERANKKKKNKIRKYQYRAMDLHEQFSWMSVGVFLFFSLKCTTSSTKFNWKEEEKKKRNLHVTDAYIAVVQPIIESVRKITFITCFGFLPRLPNTIESNRICTFHLFIDLHIIQMKEEKYKSHSTRMCSTINWHKHHLHNRIWKKKNKKKKNIVKKQQQSAYIRTGGNRKSWRKIIIIA